MHYVSFCLKMYIFVKTTIFLSKKLHMKKILFSVLMLCFALYANAQYHLAWGEYVYLEIPDPPFNGYVEHATWNVNNSNLTFDEADECGAIIYPNHYFEGTAFVTCSYRYEYYRNGRYQTATSSASYTITFKSVESVLDKSEISLTIGKTETINASFPGAVSISGNPQMTWKSSDNDIVSVSSNTGVTNWSAKIKAVASGKATITFDPVIGPPKTCVVNVEYIAPQEAILTPNPLNVTVGKTKKLGISYLPDGASAKKVTWESSNNDIVTVSANGTVKGISVGKAVVTATTDNGVKTTAEIVVLPLPSSVSLQNTMTMNIGYTKTLIPSVTPANSETSFTWKSSDTTIATVSSGKITGKRPGTVTITVSTENGKTAECEVTVNSTPVELNSKNANNRVKVIEDIVKRSINND